MLRSLKLLHSGPRIRTENPIDSYRVFPAAPAIDENLKRDHEWTSIPEFNQDHGNNLHQDGAARGEV